jgi:hypothetical protein
LSWKYPGSASEYAGMIIRLLSMASRGLLGKPDRDGGQTSKLIAIVCVAVVVVLIVFRIVWPDAARAFFNGLRLMRHIP